MQPSVIADKNPNARIKCKFYNANKNPNTPIQTKTSRIAGIMQKKYAYTNGDKI
jgi:hypothetical protein